MHNQFPVQLTLKRLLTYGMLACHPEPHEAGKRRPRMRFFEIDKNFYEDAAQRINAQLAVRV